MGEQTSKPNAIFILLAVVTAAVSIFSAVLMTEPGQSLNLPREWVFGYYSNRWVFIIINLALLLLLWIMNVRYKFVRVFWAYLATLGVIVCIIAANFLLSAFFPSYQRGANYVSVQEADKFLDDDSIIYAVEINDDVRGFPRKHLEIPHIAGANIGGEDVVMTFCALSNLPVVYPQDIGHGESDLGILIQVHNNLVLVDRESGELIQQITGTRELETSGSREVSGNKLPTYPNDMMAWAVFKELHPDATVFKYEFNRTLDEILLAIFEGPMEKQFSEQHGPIFPTLDLADSRLPNKELVWGVDLGNERAAFTQSFVEANPIHQFELGGEQLVIAYDKEHGIVSVFDRTMDGEAIEIVEIDRVGNTPQGKLKKIPIHNGVFWMVWSHWFPETEVYG